MLLLAQSDNLLSQRLEPYLSQVEARFSAELHSELDCVNDLVGHVERYRGKMLRPTLVLVSAMAGDDNHAPNDDHLTIATVVEMVHMATLVHDDILDEADMRRRGATINHLVGNEAAVMLGDYLISHAYHLCSSIGRPEVSRMIAAATNTVCEGELLQLANRNNWLLEEATYEQIIRRKTASLCGMCCRLGWMLNRPDAPSAANDPTAEALAGYGEKLGVAFQIIDDVLDLTGDEKRVGKTTGLDLEKGKLTLPMIRYLASASEADRAEAEALIRRQADATQPPQTRQAAGAELHERVRTSRGVVSAREEAGRLIDAAKEQIEARLPDTSARRLMLAMADAVVNREF